MSKKSKIGEPFYERQELEEAGFASLGENVLIKKNVGIYFPENLHIGSNVRIDDFSVIGSTKEPCFIGSYVHIASHCCILGSGGFTMEDFSGMAPQCTLVTGSDDYTSGRLTNPTVPRDLSGVTEAPIVLEKHVTLGTGCIIMPGVRIGIGSTFGAFALVTKSQEPFGVYIGAPCKKVKERSKDILELEKEVYKRESLNNN
jgi:acetyltransferase-like isoleucine patch superfamily enzyme